MKVLIFLTAEYANVTNDGKLNIMGIFNMINATKFPARHPSLHLVVKLAAELGEYNQTREMTIKLMDPDGKELMNVAGPIILGQPQKGQRPEFNAILSLRDINFPQPGNYMFVLLVDRDYKQDLPIYVQQVELPEEEAHKEEPPKAEPPQETQGK